MILILGELTVKESDLRTYALKHFGMERDELILVNDYSKIKSFDFGSLFHSTKFTDVIITQQPHSAGKSGHYSNVIQKMENEPGYPNIIRVSRTLKFSLSSFKKAVLSSVWYRERIKHLEAIHSYCGMQKHKGCDNCKYDQNGCIEMWKYVKGKK